MKFEEVTGEIVDGAITVHSALESAYEVCLAAELCGRGLQVARQVSLPVVYAGERVDLGYRIDLLVADQVIVEIKAVTVLTDVHRAQLLSYLRLSGKGVGLLLNFHVHHMREGITRLVSGW